MLTVTAGPVGRASVSATARGGLSLSVRTASVAMRAEATGGLMVRTRTAQVRVTAGPTARSPLFVLTSEQGSVNGPLYTLDVLAPGVVTTTHESVLYGGITYAWVRHDIGPTGATDAVSTRQNDTTLVLQVLDQTA